MNKLFILVFFCCTLQSLAQQQEYFNFTDTVFKINAIKRIPAMYIGFHGVGVCCGGEAMLDSIAAFLKQYEHIVLELGVYSASLKVDKEDAAYYKSLLIQRGVNADRIIAKGYGYQNHQLYAQKVIKEEFKKSEEAGKKMLYANFRIELKILQQ